MPPTPVGPTFSSILPDIGVKLPSSLRPMQLEAYFGDATAIRATVIVGAAGIGIGHAYVFTP